MKIVDIQERPASIASPIMSRYLGTRYRTVKITIGGAGFEAKSDLIDRIRSLFA